MGFDDVLEQAERNYFDSRLIATLLVQSSQVEIENLPDEKKERLYNLLASAFFDLASSTHNALQAALQRALTQPWVMEYLQHQMEASANFLDMLQNNAAAPVVLALLCSHDDEAIAQKAAIALGYSGSQIAYDMLQRWQMEGNNKKLVRAAELALPYFSTMQEEPHS
jgi:hypothetical protein